MARRLSAALRLLQGFYRADNGRRPRTLLPLTRDRAQRRLVRRPGRPALQHAWSAALRLEPRGDVARGPPLRRGGRARLEPRPGRARPRQRHLPPPRPPRLRADGRMRRGRKAPDRASPRTDRPWRPSSRSSGSTGRLLADSAMAEDRAADAHMGRAELDGRLEIRAHAHREQRQAVALRAILSSSAKCGDGGSSAGGMHIRPSIASPCCSRQRR